MGEDLRCKGFKGTAPVIATMTLPPGTGRGASGSVAGGAGPTAGSRQLQAARGELEGTAPSCAELGPAPS
jgi:hypothetical protein